MTTRRKTHKAVHSNPPAEKAPAARPTKRTSGRSKTERIGPVSRPGTKQAALIALLERPKGATIAQMCGKTGWQAHSVRAALTGFRKRGLAVCRGTNSAGSTVYSMASQPTGPSS